MTPAVQAIKTLMPALSIPELLEIENCLIERLGKQSKQTLNQKIKEKENFLKPGILKSLYK